MIFGIILINLLGIMIPKFSVSDDAYKPLYGMDESYERSIRGSSFDSIGRRCEERSHTEGAPFVIVILRKVSGNFICMGSLLSHQYVLTSFPCVSAFEAPELLLMAGYDGTWWGRGAQVRRAADVTVSDTELAVLKAKNPFKYGKQVQPISVYAPYTGGNVKDMWGSTFSVLGFPRQHWNGHGDPTPRHLSITTGVVTLVDTESPTYEECVSEYGNDLNNYTKAFCTYPNSSRCWGYLGSPTIAVNGGLTMQVGVLVRNTCENMYSRPSLHARLDYMYNWLQEYAGLP